MHTVLFILGALACPLGMFAFGGLAWITRRALGGGALGLAKLAGRGAKRRVGPSLPSEARDAPGVMVTHA